MKDQFELEMPELPLQIVLGRRSECWKDRADTGGGWNGRLYSLWSVAGSYENIQVSESTYICGV
jgi:hypothetical protein